MTQFGSTLTGFHTADIKPKRAVQPTEAEEGAGGRSGPPAVELRRSHRFPSSDHAGRFELGIREEEGLFAAAGGRRMTPVPPRRATIGAALIAMLVALSGCSSEPVPKLSVALFQNRADYASRSLQVEITNLGAEDVVIRRATFTSPFFETGGSARHLPYTLTAGSTADFPATVPAALCAPSGAKPSVTLTVRARDGSDSTMTLTPTVPFNSLASLHAQDCGRQAFERIARITPAAHLRFELRNGAEIALLDLRITPTGVAGVARLVSTTGTTLLIPTEGEVRPLDLTVTATSPPTTLTLDFVPSRCGTHVISEDKIGTLIPFHAVAGDFSDAYFRVPVSPVVKGEFYDWVGRYCGR